MDHERRDIFAIATRTPQLIKQQGTYCRGGPPWPPGVELDLGNTPDGRDGIRRRAATEGRPYSTHRGARYSCHSVVKRPWKQATKS